MNFYSDINDSSLELPLDDVTTYDILISRINELILAFKLPSFDDYLMKLDPPQKEQMYNYYLSIQDYHRTQLINRKSYLEEQRELVTPEANFSKEIEKIKRKEAIKIAKINDTTNKEIQKVSEKYNKKKK